MTDVMAVGLMSENGIATEPRTVPGAVFTSCAAFEKQKAFNVHRSRGLEHLDHGEIVVRVRAEQVSSS